MNESGAPASEQIEAVVPAISFTDVSYSYPGSEAASLKEVSFDVLPGDFVYLVGASGSGKSSLLRILYGEVKPDSGRAWAAGTNLQRLSHRRMHTYRRRLGVVFQDFKMLPGRTVAQQLEFALAVTGQRNRASHAIPEALERVGLAGKAHRSPTELSGGEVQRVAIARALVTGPSLLLADEPTGNLDPVTAHEVHEALGRVNAAGTTVVMATHDAALVDRAQRRVLRLEAGSLVVDSEDAGYWEEAS